MPLIFVVQLMSNALADTEIYIAFIQSLTHMCLQGPVMLKESGLCRILARILTVGFMFMYLLMMAQNYVRPRINSPI